MLLGRLVDDREVIGEGAHAGMLLAARRPVRLEMELLVGMAEAVEEMHLLPGAARSLTQRIV